MQVRAEAKRQGAVLDYHPISTGGIETPGHKVSDQDSIVLLTKYKNMDAYLQSVSTYEQDDLQSFVFGGVHIRKADDFLGRLNTQVFAEEHELGVQTSHQAVGASVLHNLLVL